MNDDLSNAGRRYFTLRELLVVTAVIALGFAVLIPMMRFVRAAGSAGSIPHQPRHCLYDRVSDLDLSSSARRDKPRPVCCG